MEIPLKMLPRVIDDNLMRPFILGVHAFMMKTNEFRVLWDLWEPSFNECNFCASQIEIMIVIIML